MKKYLLISIAFLLTVEIVLSQDSWTHITEINGKEIGSVSDITSENDGTIWICSSGGTFRYKENSWIDESEHFQFGEKTKPFDVVVAPNGDLWFNIFLDYLVKYDGENWYYYENPSTVRLFADIDVDLESNVWCGTYDHGVYRFDGTNWDNYTTEDGLCQRSVGRIAVSPEGDVWCRYADPYWCEGEAGGCGRYGVSRFNGATWETYSTNNGLISNYVDDIEFGSDGSIYVGCINGISRFDGSEWETFSETASGEMEFDKEGNLWALGKQSRILSKYNGSSWETYYPPRLVELSRFTGPFGFDVDGGIWLATSEGLLTNSVQTGITEESNPEPQEYILLTNYPNPFNASTTISFELPEPSWTSLHIYNTAGRKIVTFIDDTMSAGMHTVTFDGSNLASGLYFYRFESPGLSNTGKMLLVK